MIVEKNNCSLCVKISIRFVDISIHIWCSLSLQTERSVSSNKYSFSELLIFAKTFVLILARLVVRCQENKEKVKWFIKKQSGGVQLAAFTFARYCLFNLNYFCRTVFIRIEILLTFVQTNRGDLRSRVNAIQRDNQMSNVEDDVCCSRSFKRKNVCVMRRKYKLNWIIIFSIKIKQRPYCLTCHFHRVHWHWTTFR